MEKQLNCAVLILFVKLKVYTGKINNWPPWYSGSVSDLISKG